jgi:hypothetical protein
MLVSLTATAAFAKTRRANITFDGDTMVNGTLLKKGDYQFSYNETKGEVTFKHNGKEILRAPARTETLDRKTNGTEVRFSNASGEPTFVGVSFGGSKTLIELG